MLDSSIPDIAIEREFALLKVKESNESKIQVISCRFPLLWQLQEKFRFDLSEEEAVQFIQEMIQESVSALFPQMMETIHKWAQYWRK